LLTQSRINSNAFFFGNFQNQAGALFGWGSNSDGMLGHLGTLEQLWPLAVDAVSGIRFKKLAAGQFHSLAITGNTRDREVSIQIINIFISYLIYY